MAREVSEHDATLAVEAAAKAEYERVAEPGSMPWEDVPATIKLALRQHCLGIVWAALGALPDQRHTAWLEGLYCGLRQGHEDDNPYPAPEA